MAGYRNARRFEAPARSVRIIACGARKGEENEHRTQANRVVQGALGASDQTGSTVSPYGAAAREPPGAGACTDDTQHLADRPCRRPGGHGDRRRVPAASSRVGLANVALTPVFTGAEKRTCLTTSSIVGWLPAVDSCRTVYSRQHLLLHARSGRLFGRARYGVP
jgi:hypothetical protein